MRFVVWLLILAGFYAVGMGVSGRGQWTAAKPVEANHNHLVPLDGSRTHQRLHLKSEYEPQVIAEMVERADQLTVQIEGGEHEVSAADMNFARELIQAAHSDLQLAGLRLLWFLPADNETFAAVLDVIQNTADELVFEMGLQHLSRFSGREDFAVRVHDVLVTQIRQGLNEDMSLAAVQIAMQYMRPDRRQTYENLAQEMKSYPRRQKALMHALEEQEKNTY